MTIRDYITQKLSMFDLNDATLAEFSSNVGLPLDTDYSIEYADMLGRAQVPLIEEMVLMPKVSSINENGFSMSWDYGSLGKYYLWLCRKYGIKANDDVKDMLGISMIIDRTDSW